MGVKGTQDIWRVGARVYFRRKGVTSNDYLDMGVIQSITPNFASDSQTLNDPDGGVNTPFVVNTTSFTEAYTLECSNFSPEMLALAWGSPSPENWSQAATPLTGISHSVGKRGNLVKLVDGNGMNVYNVDTITITGQVEDTDWEWVNKKRGLFRVIPTGGIAENAVVSIDITPNVVEEAPRLLYPQKESGATEGDAIISLSRDDFGNETFRECEVSIAAAGNSLSASDFSSHTLELTVLSDKTDNVSPAGRMLQAVGTPPTG